MISPQKPVDGVLDDQAALGDDLARTGRAAACVQSPDRTSVP